MLDTAIRQQLQSALTHLVEPLELQADFGTGPIGAELREFLADISQASPLIEVVEKPSSRAPSFAVTRKGHAPRVTFAGVPTGHEFTSLVLALLWVSGHPVKMSDTDRQAVARLKGPLAFEAYISLSCHNCPDVVQALVQMAVVHPDVHVTVIDGAAFVEEVEARGVLAVPSVFLNGEHFSAGRMALSDILAKLDTAALEHKAQALGDKPAFDVLVVGGGPAGAAAAVYAARKGVKVGLVTDRIGGQTNDTLGIENFISVVQTTGPQFSADLTRHVAHYGVDVMTGERAAALVAAPPAGLHEVRLDSGAVLRARTVVLATGARWRNVNVPGEQQYKNRGVAYCPHCDGPLFKGKRTAVIGGGNSGVEAAIDLAGIVEHVTVVEYAEQLKADAVLVDKLRSLPNVTVVTGAQTTEIAGNGSKVTGLRYRNRASGQEHEVPLEGVFVQIGLVPNTEFAKDALKLNKAGEIEIDSRCQTSAPGIFAAGDGTNVPYKQIIIAAGEGAKAALSAFDHLIRA